MQTLDCIIQGIPDTNTTPQKHLLGDYVSMALFTSEAFTMNAVTLHTFILNQIAVHDNAEAKIQNITNHQNGRMGYYTMKYHY